MSAKNLYMWFPKTAELAGTSTTEEVKGKKAIELLSYSHGISMPLSGSAVSGQARHQGRSSHGDFTISKYVDQTTPHFNGMCAGGNLIPEIEIAVFQASEDSHKSVPVKFITYTLTEAIITSVSVGAGGGDLPIETITFNYGTIKWAFAVQDNKTGKGAADKTVSWSLFKNAAA